MSSNISPPEQPLELQYARPEPSFMVRFLRSREIGVLSALLLLVVIMSVLKFDAFLSATNLFNLTRQIAFTAIVAIGVLFVILTGGVDLSLGSTVGLTGFVAGFAVMKGAPPAAAVAMGALTGVIVGSINGSIVSYVGVTPFIVTLGMLTIGRSVIYMMYGGANILNMPDSFSAIANGGIPLPGTNLAMPVPVIILIGLAVLAHVVLTYSTFGRRIYAIGGNEEATYLSGINVRTIKFLAYVVCSTICAITGLLYLGRFRSAVANAGVGLELDAIAAAVIGGTSLMGGQGSVLGVVIGACIMGVVNNAITLLGIKSEAQGTIIGGIIIAAAILDVIRSRRSAKR